MRNSFVLKDCTGNPHGYLMQAGDEILCRAQSHGSTDVTLLFSDGSHVQHGINGNGRELRWQHPGRMLVGGFVREDGRLLMYSDDDAVRVFRLEMTEKKPEKADSAENRTEQADGPAFHCSCAAACFERVIPQRRWPPPCCMPSVYQEGEWKELQPVCG